MRWTGHAALALAVLSVPATASAQTETPAISVTGEASVSAPPDLAMIEAGVSSDAKTAREASEATNATMGKVMLALKSAGIPERDVQTQRLSLQPQYPQNRGGTAAITSYRASNRVVIKLRDMALVPSTIDVLVGAGANEIGGVEFTLSQPSKLLDDARMQAVADARRKAEIYAKAAGVELGVPLSISEDGGAPVAMRKTFRVAATAPTPIAPGEETLRVTVAVTWAIKQAADGTKSPQ
jgi:uncharacterized protein